MSQTCCVQCGQCYDPNTCSSMCPHGPKMSRRGLLGLFGAIIAAPFAVLASSHPFAKLYERVGVKPRTVPIASGKEWAPIPLMHETVEKTYCGTAEQLIDEISRKLGVPARLLSKTNNPDPAGTQLWLIAIDSSKRI